MSGQTPVERAAEAMHALGNSDPWERQHEYVRQDCTREARVVFESIDVDELARALRQATDAGADRTEDYARAVVAHLTKGDESNE